MKLLEQEQEESLVMHITRNTTEEKQCTTLETDFAFIDILQAGKTSSIPVAAAKATFSPAATDTQNLSLH